MILKRTFLSVNISKNIQKLHNLNIGRTEKGQEYEHGTLIAKTKNDDVICYEILTTDNNSYLLNVFDDKRCINKLQHKNIYFDVESKIVHDDMIKFFISSQEKNHCHTNLSLSRKLIK